MSAKGMTTRQVSVIIEDIYGFEVSESMITGITNKILPQIEEWRKIVRLCFIFYREKHPLKSAKRQPSHKATVKLLFWFV